MTPPTKAWAVVKDGVICDPGSDTLLHLHRDYDSPEMALSAANEDAMLPGEHVVAVVIVPADEWERANAVDYEPSAIIQETYALMMETQAGITALFEKAGSGPCHAIARSQEIMEPAFDSWSRLITLIDGRDELCPLQGAAALTLLLRRIGGS